MRFIFLFALAAVSVRATVIRPLSFEELTSQSDQILAGHVVRKWTSWGSEHKYVWTRYEIAVEAVWKGAPAKSVIVSELGGALDGVEMHVAGTVVYREGEHVALFLHQFPSGDKRTVGWAQGKLSIDANGKVHPGSASDRSGAATPISKLDGLTLAELHSRVEAVEKRAQR